MNESQIPEGMVRLAHALVEDASLRSWFLALEALPNSIRRIAFSEMADQMTAGREEPELISALSALARPEIYAAVRDAVRERCGV